MAIPVFARSFEMGIFNYLMKRRLILVIATWLLLPGGAGILLYVTIIILSINNHLIGFFVFLAIFIIDGGFSSSGQEVLMQVLLFIFFITRMNINIKYFALFIFTMIISAYFVPNSIVKLLPLIDSNLGWRLSFWIANIKSTINDTFLFGHGFGTSYFNEAGRQLGTVTTIRMPDEVFRQYGESLYTAEFIMPQHNSFINAFYRLGIIGLSFFLAYFINIAKQMKIFCAPYQINYLLLLSMIVIGINVGLESPRFAMRFVFIIGLSQYIVFEYYKTYLINNY